jgi:anti-anti-sigma factor
MVDRTDNGAGSFRVHAETGGHVLFLSGDIDAPVMERLSRDHGVEGLRIIAVDVGEVQYIDSTALSFLATWAENARRDGRRAEIRHANQRFDRVLEVAGLASLFVSD